MNPTPIHAQSLRRGAYAPYGDVVAADPSLASRSANQGTAERYNHLGKVENLRPTATPNLCVFRSQPFVGERFEVRLLERHKHSTQVFIPMAAQRYLVIVCGGGDEPDLKTLRAFIADRHQGVTYFPGTWHHPLIALDQVTDFACLVYEDNSDSDCETRPIVASVSVKF